MKRHLITHLLRSLWPLLTLGLIGLLPSISSAQQPGTSPVKIYVLVGQSNMEGKGQISGLATPGTLEYTVANEPATYGFLKDGGGNWVVRDDVWIHFERNPISLKYGGLTPGYGSSDSMVGPEIGFGHAIGGVQANQVLLIKTAWGGKSLGNDFLPPSSGPYPTPRVPGDAGFYYAEILRLVDDATNKLATYFPSYNGQGYEIAGLCFHQGWNDQYGGLDAVYETNLVNFINDIRSNDKGLGVPELPIVIASSGMIPGASLIKDAQLAMDDAVTYPQFAGNVAVVDTEQTYTPLGLSFMQTVANSPTDQAFHWHQNGKTYTNIGLAMAHEMPLLTVPRCPSRLRATGNATGVVLSWQNGSETPTSVQVLRDGVEIAAAAPSAPALFTDTTALPGTHAYELVFTMPVSPCDPLTVSHNSGIENLIAYRGTASVNLEWQNNLGYTGIELRRNGTVVQASLPGTTTTYTDTTAPASGVLTYSLVPTTGTSTAAEVQINLGPHDSGGALIYEPFDYPATTLLAGNSGAAGTSGAWTATVGPGGDVTPVGLSYGSLPVAGNKAENAQFTRENEIALGTTLSAAGLLADGATLWFSFLINPVNTNNSGTTVTFGNGLASRSGVGVNVGGTTANYQVTTNGTTAKNLSANSQLSLLKTQLIVGKLTWGVDGADDEFLIYFPDTDLNQGDASRSATPFNVDQATFDRLTINMYSRGAQFDEIRFGASYQAVIGAGIDTSADFTPPIPSQMSWETPPAAQSESSINMTTVTASDDNGVEYQFTRYVGASPVFTSGWQLSRSFTDTGLQPNTTYGYTVQAQDRSVNHNPNSASSPIATATTDPVDETAPPTPVFVTPLGPVNHTSITMTVTPVSDPGGNGVQYLFTETSGNPGATSSGWQTSSTYTDTGLTSGATYSYTVTARDTAPIPNVSLASAAESATTLVDGQAPPAPTFVTPLGPVTYNSITMTANPVADPEGNGVEYLFTETSGNPGATSSGWQTSSSYTDSGLTPEMTYSYTVTARDTAPIKNVSAPSAAQSATTFAEFTGVLTDVSTVAAGGNSLISVTPGQFQGFSANTGTVNTAFNNPVLDYGFYGNNSAYGNTKPGGGSRISTLTNPQANNDYTDYWITSDPLTQAANQTNSGSRTGTSAQGLTSGTINISGLTSGSVYIFHGRWQTAATDYLLVTMTGTAGTVTLPTAGATPTSGGPLMWATRIDFSDPADNYSTITYTHYVNAGAGGGYMSGVVLTTPPPVATDPYVIWSGGAEPLPFDGDKNGDGVKNGLAFLLGASTPTSAVTLPTTTQSGGNLTLSFNMLKTANRGSATLSVQHSRDLGISDPWTTVLVTDSNSGPTNGVTFVVTPGGGTSNGVTATISSSEAGGTGKLFGCLKATAN